MKAHEKRPKAKCPVCGSLERNRVFWDAYRNRIAHEFPLDGKSVLAVSPSAALRRYLLSNTVATTCDIRPLRVDIQADICSMPQLETRSFDAIIAVGVMQHCHDDVAAFAEFHRVLKPWGRVFIHTACRSGRETALFEEVTKHYGVDSLERYNVGTFRVYGEYSLLRLMQRNFLVKTYDGRDAISGRNDTIYCGIRDGRADVSDSPGLRRDRPLAQDLPDSR